MKKLIQGIIDFRARILPARRELFATLAKGQNPDSLFITCSDSRVAPNWFASTDPGDLFVVRNVGNLICPCGTGGVTAGDESELAAVEFAVMNLKVSDIIVCGHSECGAMQAIESGAELSHAPHLKSWLRHGEPSLRRLETRGPLSAQWTRLNQLSQWNVLQQLDHLKSYSFIQERLEAKTLNLHGWWFDIAKADIYAFNSTTSQFEIIGA